MTATPPPTSTRSKGRRASRSTRAAVSLDWGEHAHQHHRHARPRRLHGRGRALACASSTAPSASSAPSAASRCSRETVWYQANKHKRAAHRLRQQARPHGRRLLRLHRADEGEAARASPAICTIPAGQSQRVRGRHRPDRDEVHPASDDDRQDQPQVHARRHPRVVQGRGRRCTASSCSKPPRTPTTSSPS